MTTVRMVTDRVTRGQNVARSLANRRDIKFAPDGLGIADHSAKLACCAPCKQRRTNRSNAKLPGPAPLSLRHHNASLNRIQNNSCTNLATATYTRAMSK